MPCVRVCVRVDIMCMFVVTPETYRSMVVVHTCTENVTAFFVAYPMAILISCLVSTLFESSAGSIFQENTS